MYFSPSTGFTLDPRPGAVAITEAEHAALMAGQAAGRQIVAGAAGHPALVWPEAAAPTPLDIKAEARRRIIAIADEDRQRNLTARGVELLRVGTANWTSAEQAEADAIDAVWQAIKAIRAASDTIEAMDPIPADFTDPAYWP